MNFATPEQSYRRLIYALALSVGVSFGAILYGTSVLITSTAAGSEFSISRLSLAFSGSVLTGAAAAIHIGRHLDRHGARGVIGCGGALVMLGFLAFSLSTAEWQVLASWWLLVGPGSAMVLFEPAFVAIQQWFSRELRNRAAGTLTLITGLAGPVFIPSTAYLVEMIGWRPTAALLGAVVFVVSGTTASWALRAAPRLDSSGAAPNAGLTTKTIPQLHRSAKASEPRRRLPTGFIPLTLSIALTMAVLEAYNLHRIARFEATGFNPEVLAWWAAAVGILSLPARFVLPLLANRFNSARLWVWLTVLIMPGVWLSVRGTEAWEMNGHFIIFGLLFGAFMPLRAVVMSDWYSGARFGALMGIQAVAIAVGRALGPAVVGWLADTSLGYSAGMALLAGLLVISLLCMLMALRRRNPATRSERGVDAVSMPPLGTVQTVQASLGRAGIPSVVGGSALLASLGLTREVHDWDLVTEGDPADVRKVVDALGLPYRQKEPVGIFRSAAVFTVGAEGHEIDVLVGFALDSSGTAVSIPAEPGERWNGLTMARPEDWAVAYRLLGRTEQARALENHLST